MSVWGSTHCKPLQLLGASELELMTVICGSYITAATETDAVEVIGKHTWVFMPITFLSFGIFFQDRGSYELPMFIGTAFS